ncbi:MAG: hypothetical protein ACK4SY_08250 [Pyrobaculum sp.]
MDVLDVPGCPEGSLRVVSYIQERQPAVLVVRTPDADCVKVLQLVLPLFDYSVVETTSGDIYMLKVKRRDV